VARRPHAHEGVDGTDLADFCRLTRDELAGRSMCNTIARAARISWPGCAAAQLELARVKKLLE
jgi:hypothetical protein